MEAQARRPSVSSQRRRSTVERLLGLAPAAPTTDPNQVEVAQSVTSSPLEENLEALETLKEVSLHALSVLVRQLVDAEPPESAVSNEASSPVIPRALIPRSFSTPHTALSSIADKESIEDVTERAEHIPDGGEIAAVLKQSTHDRARSADLLSRSRDKLAGLDSNAAEAGPGVSTSASPLGSASCSEARTSPGHVRSGEDIFTDHGLALALAALCNGLYQLLDITYATPAAPASPRARSRRPSVSLASQASNTTATPPAGGDDAVYSRVVEHMSAVQTHRQQVQLADLRPDQQTLWAEIDRLMVLVQAICSTRQQSASPSTAAEPRLSAVKSTQPPSYQEVLDMGGKVAHSKEKGHRLSIDELGQVVSAIDRVFRTAPRLDNQSVLLNARQEKVMSAAALTALIDRLNRGKEPYQTQRATPPAGKYGTLESLVDQITAIGTRSLNNQRVTLSATQQHKMDFGRLARIINKQAKRRFENQDYITKEERILSELGALHEELVKIGARTRKYTEQRYEMSTQKQKDLFIHGLAAKMDRLEDRRMGNQDALTRTQRQEERFEEIDKIMDRMAAPLHSQRASPNMRRMSLSGR